MSVSKKLSLGFIIVLVLAAAVSIIGIIGMRSLRESGSYMYEKRVASLSYVNSARTAYDMARISGRILVVNSFFDDKKGAVDANDAFEKYIKEFHYWMEQSRAVSDTDELTEFHDRLQEQVEQFYLPCARRINENSINDIPGHANRLAINTEMAYLSTITAKIDGYMNGLVDLNDALAKQTDIDNAWLARIYMLFTVTLLLVAVASATIVSRIIIKSIAVPISEAEGVLAEIAKGNFSARITGSYKGEFETIKNSLNYTAMQLAVYIQETIAAQEIVNKLNIEKARVEAASEAMFSGINYASSIQRNILPPNSVLSEAFSDYSVIWKPRDIVGGDIYWLKNFEKGSLLCVCDCTGHGTPGALLTMLVTSTFDTMVTEENCRDTAQVIYMLDKRLSGVLNAEASSARGSVREGCDLAVLFIDKNGSVSISSGHTHVFVCDGKAVTQVKGQNLYIGEGSLKGKDEVKVTTLPANNDNKFYVASDGLYDQGGGENDVPFGYKNVNRLILGCHNESMSFIAGKIWENFELHRGTALRLDDFQLIAFKV